MSVREEWPQCHNRARTRRHIRPRTQNRLCCGSVLELHFPIRSATVEFGRKQSRGCRLTVDSPEHAAQTILDCFADHSWITVSQQSEHTAAGHNDSVVCGCSGERSCGTCCGCCSCCRSRDSVSARRMDKRSECLNKRGFAMGCCSCCCACCWPHPTRLLLLSSQLRLSELTGELRDCVVERRDFSLQLFVALQRELRCRFCVLQSVVERGPRTAQKLQLISVDMH